MGPFVLLHVALVGFFCCAALYSAWTWWHARADRTLLLFAGQCLLSVVLSANFVMIATAGDARRASLGLSGRLTGWRPRIFVNGVAAFVAFTCVYHLGMRSMQSGVTTLTRVTLAWGET